MPIDHSVLKSNVNKLLWLNFSWMFLLIQAIMVPYFQSRGLSMTEIFLVQAIFSLTLCVLDVPAGYLSDRLGRRSTLMLASIFKGLGGVLLALARDWTGFAAAYALIGVANSLYSGTDVALLYESQEALPRAQSEPSGLFGRRVFYAQLGFAAAAIFGGLLSHISLELTVLLNSVFAWIPLLISYRLTEAPRRLTPPRSHRAHLGRVYAAVWRDTAAPRRVVAASILYGAAPMLALFAFQGLWKEARLPFAAFGLLTAAYSLSGAAAGRYSARLQRRIGGRGVCLLLGVLPLAGFLGAGLAPVFIAVALGALVEMGQGLTQSYLKEKFNAAVDSDIRATANSVVSLGARLLAAAAGPLLGVLADRRGLQPALLGLGLFFAAVFWVSAVPMARENQS